MRVINITLWAGGLTVALWMCLLWAHTTGQMVDITTPFRVNFLNESWWPNQFIAQGITFPGLVLAACAGLLRACRR